MAFEGARDRWEHMEPREKRLAVLFGVTLVVCVFIFMGMQIRGRLVALENKNQLSRDAIRSIEQHQADPAASAAADTAAALIGDTAPPLATYLEGIATEIGFTIPETNVRPVQPRGKYQELSIEIKLRGISLEQLAQFLKLVETRQPAVVTTRLYVKPYISAHEKLDVELTIATFEKAKKVPQKGGDTGAAKTDGDKPGG